MHVFLGGELKATKVRYYFYFIIAIGIFANTLMLTQLNVSMPLKIDFIITLQILI